MFANKPIHELDPETLDLIDRALREDGVEEDVSTLSTVPEDRLATGRLLSKSAGVLCGVALFRGVFERLDAPTEVTFLKEDGETLEAGDVVAQLQGKAQNLLSAERLALNLIGRFSGVATRTADFVREIEGTNAVVIDTRKTTPLWRKWEKYAVRMGGGMNHRFNLSDMILLKDNHVALAGDAGRALRLAKIANHKELDIEIEVDTLEQLDRVLDEGVHRVLLDNMSPELLSAAVERVDRRFAENKERRPILEASGGVRLDTIRAIAETGVNLISVGALTHSADCFDFSLEIATDPDSECR